MAVLLLALKSLLVAAATLALLRLNRSRSAAERSTIAHLGLFALVALPLASLTLPSLKVAAPAPVARLAAPAAQDADLLPWQGATTAPADEAVAPPPADTPSPVARAAAAVAQHAYLVPTAALLLVTMVALLRLVGLRARAEVLVDAAWLGALARAQRRMGFKNGTALLRSNELGSPVSWGLMRPTILLNEAAVEAPDQAEAIIAHELAHVVHLDWAKLVLARVATALFWFNPLAWLLAREAHQLREEAADDAVLAADIAGPDYAQLLIGVARHECRGALLGAHGVAPSKSSLGRRVRRVLDGSPARGPSGRSWIAGFATGMLCMAVPLAAVTIGPGTVTPVAAADGSHGKRLVTRTERHGVGGGMTVDVSGPMNDTIGHVVGTSVAASPQGPDGPIAADANHARQPQDDVDQLVEMRAAGIPLDDRRAMAAAGFPHLTTAQLAGARTLGMTADFVRAMRATGVAMSFDDMLGARATGLDPAYVGALRRLGVIGSLNDYQGMRAVGVTPGFVRGLRARGINVTSPDKLTALRTVSDDNDP